MKPAYAEAATDMKITLSDAHLVAIDATKTPGLTQRFTLQGYPTIKYFESGEYKFDYSGGRSKDDIINFMKNPKEKEVPKTQNVVEDKWSNLPGYEHVNMLTDKSFEEFITSKAKVLVMFYAPCKLKRFLKK